MLTPAHQKTKDHFITEVVFFYLLLYVQTIGITFLIQYRICVS
jgi:hypothetical protein